MIQIQNLRQFRNIRLAIGLNYFIAGLIFASWACRIPDIASRLRLDDATLGAALFAIPAGQMAMMAVTGYLTSRLGSRLMLTLGIGFYALVLNLIPIASGFAGLFGILVLFGAAANVVNIALNTQACNAESLYHRNIMASFHGVWSLGGFTGGIIGMAFVRVTDIISLNFLAIGVMSIIGVLLSARFFTQDVNSERGSSESSVLSKIDRIIILLGVMGFAGMFCEGTLFDWSGVYFDSVVRPDDGLIRLGYVAGMAMMTLGRFIADGLVAGFGPATILRAVGLGIAIGLLLLSIFPNLVCATLGFMFVGIGISSIVPICYSLAGHHGKIASSTAITLVSSISFLGFMIGPPLIGFVAEWLNLRIAMGLASAFGFIIIILSEHLKNLSKKTPMAQK